MRPPIRHVDQVQAGIAWPKITRRLQRLCDEFGWETVLAVFSNDMPEHRQERARQERELRRHAYTLSERALEQVRLEGFELATVAIIAGTDLDFRRPAEGDLLGIVIPPP